MRVRLALLKFLLQIYLPKSKVIVCIFLFTCHMHNKWNIGMFHFLNLSFYVIIIIIILTSQGRGALKTFIQLTILVVQNDINQNIYITESVPVNKRTTAHVKCYYY